MKTQVSGCRRSILAALCSIPFVLAAGCTGVPAVQTTPPPQDDCQMQVDSVSQTAVDVEAGFKHMVTSFSADVNVDQLNAVKTGFDEIQRDYSVQAMRLCKDRRAGMSNAEYSARRTCLDRTLTTMRTIELLLKSKKDSKEMAWIIDSKLEALANNLECEIPPPGAGAPVGGTDMHYVTDAGAPVLGKNVELEAALVCQRKVGGKFQDIPNCNRAVMKEDDRFKIRYKTAGPSRIYIILTNDTGQFQMLFPDPGVDNEAMAGVEYTVPGENDWFELDNVSGVMETVQIIASNYKIAELENLRGTDIAGTGKKRVGRKMMPKVAMKTRGIIEPVLFRGVKKKKTRKPVEAGSNGDPGDAAKAIPLVTSRPDVAAVEMWIDHQ